jgi:ribosomal protein S1
MGQKVNPIGLRLGINRTWDSRWYAARGEYAKLLHEDMQIREVLMKALKQAAVSKIIIERPHKKCRVAIHSARPGVVIGKKGADIDKIRKLVTKITDFGAFMEIEEGVEGLIYVSELSEQRVEKPSDIVKLGEKVRAEILSIEPKDRRISLSIKQLGRSEERANYETYMGDRNKKTSMGDILGEKLKGALKKDE